MKTLNELAFEVANGNENAFNEIHNQIAPRFIALARKYKNVAEYEDLFQDFMLKAYETCFTFKEGSYLQVLYRVCKNHCTDLYRKSQTVAKSKYHSVKSDLHAPEGHLNEPFDNAIQLDYVVSLEDSVIGNIMESSIAELLEDFKTVSLRDYEILKCIEADGTSLDVAQVVNAHSRNPVNVQDVKYTGNMRVVVSRAKNNFKSYLEQHNISPM